MASETMTAEEFRRELERLRREYEEKLASAELQKTAERHIIDRKAEEARKANEAYLNEYVASLLKPHLEVRGGEARKRLERDF